MPPNYQGSTIDVTKFFSSRSDARSQSFNFGGWNEHKFTVEKAGRYLIESSSRAGMSTRYRIEAQLLDDRGNVVAESEALGSDEGGLHMSQELEPGDYVLRVNAREFGDTKLKGNRYTISVAGLDERGNRLSAGESGIEEPSGIGYDREAEGPTTAFVRSPDATAALAAPVSQASSTTSNAGVAADTTGDSTPTSDTTAAGSASQASANQAFAEDTPAEGFKEVVTDVDMRYKGKALSFDVRQAGTVAVSTSTMSGYEGTYRIEARILDSDGNVVASEKGSRFAGDIDIETVLQPGSYTVWVSGQNYGNPNDVANNYALRVKQLDVR
ncbi:hypothetical protein R6258_10855 [Halomonas sp. HP20-15]|uniref:hypothetical protein n=1 Tax=Halomonas sp. HP20-15 TaxID=3085901 RepID=UPI002980E594|nr:hypothetical protein [Halomonas sp. HP20-15]MDW5377415.1 hypothetical protein [Halomonas sp. HP20-15]